MRCVRELRVRSWNVSGLFLIGAHGGVVENPGVATGFGIGNACRGLLEAITCIHDVVRCEGVKRFLAHATARAGIWITTVIDERWVPVEVVVLLLLFCVPAFLQVSDQGHYKETGNDQGNNGEGCSHGSLVSPEAVARG